MEEFSSPFDEEFDLDDVVNKNEINSGIADKSIKKERDPEFLKNELSNDDLDKIINYDQERRKKMSFSNRLSEEIELTDTEFDLENTFRDFLVAPKISGKGKLKGDAHIYPQSKVIKTNQMVEITSTPSEKTRKHDKASVMINRDDRGDVENIEIVCACGEMILLKFDSDDNLDDGQTKIISKKVENPIPFGNEASFEDIEVGSLTDEEEDIQSDDIFEEFSSTDKSNDNFEGSKSQKSEDSTDTGDDEIFWEDDFSSDEDIDTGDVDLSDI